MLLIRFDESKPRPAGSASTFSPNMFSGCTTLHSFVLPQPHYHTLMSAKLPLPYTPRISTSPLDDERIDDPSNHLCQYLAAFVETRGLLKLVPSDSLLALDKASIILLSF